MAKLLYKNGVASVTLRVFLQDTSSSSGAGKTGLGIASAGLIVAHIADNEATATAYTAAGSTIETITTLGTFAAPTATKCRFKEVDSTNLPGVYELQIADARWAVSSAKSAVVSVQATGVAPRYLEVQLASLDVNDSVRAGLTALPNAAAGANGGLPLGDASARVDVGKWLGTAVSTPTVAGVPNVNAKTWNDLATVALPLIPTTAGRTLDVSTGGEAGLDWANVGSPTTTNDLSGTTIKTTQKVDVDTIKTNPVVNAGTVTFPTTATLASTTNLTAGTIASVSGAVGSVTGAVGSVTGLTAATVHSDLDDIQSRLPAALTSGGNMKAGIQGFLDSVFTEGATGRIAAAFKQFFNIATPAATMDHGILVDTVTTYTGDTPQTGDSFARLGAAGAGLTALGDTRIANLDATISSRTKPADTQAAVTTVTNLTNAPTAGDFTATMKTSLNAATPAVTVSDKTGFSLSAAGIQAIWDALTSALTTVGSIGKWIVDKLDVVLSTRLATSGYTAPLDAAGTRTAVGLASANLDTQIAAIQADADNLQTRVPAALTSDGLMKADTLRVGGTLQTAGDLAALAVTIASYIDTEVAAIKAKTDNLPADPADASDIATSFSSLASTLSTIAGYIDIEVAAIKAKTDNLPASPAATGDIPTTAQIADKVLGRSLATGADGTRTVQDALRFLRNKVVIAGSTITIYAEDDTTAAWTGTIARTAADAISSVDPT